MCVSAAVTGYQQPTEAASGYTCQFYISLLDANNKDVPLEEKGVFVCLEEKGVCVCLEEKIGRAHV